MTAKPQISIKSLYDLDYCRWLEETANALRQGNYDELDIANLLDEIESMARRDKRELESDLIVVLHHLLKWQFQPEKRSRSWDSSIWEHRRRVKRLLEDSPSLKNHLAEEYDRCYASARVKAAKETGLPPDTFPVNCPYTPEQSLDFDYLPGDRSLTGE